MPSSVATCLKTSSRIDSGGCLQLAGECREKSKNAYMSDFSQFFCFVVTILVWQMNPQGKCSTSEHIRKAEKAG